MEQDLNQTLEQELPQYIKLKDYPFRYVPFNWIICIKFINTSRHIICGTKWDVINTLASFVAKDKLLNSNVIKVSTSFDIIVIEVDFELTN